MKKLTVICMTLFAMLFAVSCRGPMGPEGPAGPAGQDGNANVCSSTVTVRSSDWYWNETSWRVDLGYEAINANITDYGAVLVYMEDNNTWRQIPLTFYYSIVEEGVEYFYSSSLEVSTYDQGVSIFWTENDFYDGYRPDHDIRFKIVVIAASVYQSRSDVDYSNYDAVKTAFQLAD